MTVNIDFQKIGKMAAILIVVFLVYQQYKSVTNRNKDLMIQLYSAKSEVYQLRSENKNLRVSNQKLNDFLSKKKVYQTSDTYCQN